MPTDLRKYLAPTVMLDCEHPAVKSYAAEVTRGSRGDPRKSAVRLYYAVRDGIRYDPYVPFHLPEHYRASRTLAFGRGYCVGKAALLCTLARACRIPCRLGFATVRNHLASRELIESLGSDRFVYHGFVEFRLLDQWIKATPTFNAELCRRYRVDPLEFDGRSDAIFQPFNRENRPYMEYLSYHGTFDDVPVEAIVDAWKEAYGVRRVQGWIAAHASGGWRPRRDFDAEEPLPS